MYFHLHLFITWSFKLLLKVWKYQIAYMTHHTSAWRASSLRNCHLRLQSWIRVASMPSRSSIIIKIRKLHTVLFSRRLKTWKGHDASTRPHRHVQAHRLQSELRKAWKRAPQSCLWIGTLDGVLVRPIQGSLKQRLHQPYRTDCTQIFPEVRWQLH